MVPMKTLEAVDGPSPSRERALDASPLRKYAAGQVSLQEGGWHPRGLKCRHKHLLPMQPLGAASAPPSRERPSNAPPRREYVAE